METKHAAVVVWLGLMIAPAVVMAHHGLDSQFDTRRTITLKGTVTKFDWSNPHVRLYVDVKDEHNAVSNWELDLASPNLQILNGWKIDEFKPGDRVTIDAYPARNHSKIGYAKRIKPGIN